MNHKVEMRHEPVIDEYLSGSPVTNVRSGIFSVDGNPHKGMVFDIGGFSVVGPYQPSYRNDEGCMNVDFSSIFFGTIYNLKSIEDLKKYEIRPRTKPSN
ncbi:MAG TPA: hypothetical protein VJI46_07285 [Candidatus Nanoarchaeia archaeon]|nr:hypothetical protein [Candidatus Nanoarchaeia archaeon]